MKLTKNFFIYLSATFAFSRQFGTFIGRLGIEIGTFIPLLLWGSGKIKFHHQAIYFLLAYEVQT